MSPFKFPSAKAVYGFVLAFASALVTATADGSSVTTNEWLIALVGALIAAGGVWGVTSTDTKES